MIPFINHELLMYLHNRPATLLLLRLLRRFRSLHIPWIGYVVSDPLLAANILTHASFSSGDDRSLGGLITPIAGPSALFNMDGAGHHTLKQQMMRLFSPDYIDSILQATLPNLLTQLRDDFEHKRVVDFVAFTESLTNRIMLHLLGVDGQTEHLDEIAGAVRSSVRKFNAALHISKVRLTDAELTEIRRDYDRVRCLVETHGHNRPDSFLNRARELGLSPDDAYGLLMVIIAAGTETTNVTLPRMLALLLDHDQYAKLKHNRHLMSQAIDEAVRVTTPSPAIVRAVTDDACVDGYHFRAGQRVLLLLYNMTKHPNYIDRPHQFDIEREIPPALRHLAFGRGAHFCLGFMLSRREAEWAMSALLDIDGRPRIVRRGYPRNQVFPGYTQLLIEMDGC